MPSRTDQQARYIAYDCPLSGTPFTYPKTTEFSMFKSTNRSQKRKDKAVPEKVWRALDGLPWQRSNMAKRPERSDPDAYTEDGESLTREDDDRTEEDDRADAADQDEPGTPKDKPVSTSGQATSSSDENAESEEDPPEDEPTVTQESKKGTDARQPQADEDEYDYLDADEEFHKRLDAAYQATAPQPTQQNPAEHGVHELLFRMCNSFEAVVFPVARRGVADRDVPCEAMSEPWLLIVSPSEVR